MSTPIDASLDLLDLDRTATLADAKKARRELALIWHPDRFPNDEALRLRAESKLKAINVAYEDVCAYLNVAALPQPVLAAPEPRPTQKGHKTITLPGIPLDERTLNASVGLEVSGNRFAEIIAKGTTAPCAVGKRFTNARDFQEELTIRVRAGNRTAPASDARLLGEVTILDLPPGPRGFVRMEVVFAIDDTGTLAIGATDLDTREPILVRLNG